MFAFNESTCKDEMEDEDKLISVNQDVVIAPSENGGILVLREKYESWKNPEFFSQFIIPHKTFDVSFDYKIK